MTLSSEDPFRPVKVRCHELAPTLGDLRANLRRIEASIARAVHDDVELLVLPELATTGYHLKSRNAALRVALTLDGIELTELAAGVAPDMHVVLGICERFGDSVYNTAVLLSCDGVVAAYRKTHLWGSENDIFEPGDDEPPVVDLGTYCLGLLICFDLEFPEMPRSLALRGADMIAVPTNWPSVHRPSGEHPPEIIHAMAAARASGIGIACCDRAGAEDGERWTRGTVIIAADGWIASRDTIADGGTKISDASLRPSAPRDNLISTLKNRRPELYSALTLTNSTIPSRPRWPSSTGEHND